MVHQLMVHQLEIGGNDHGRPTNHSPEWRNPVMFIARLE
jgi:hypothetical protein